ncbi:MAG: LLM class F420-dependent oxidoreductase [Acidimicrobiia bacterium]|nr:LLM class F420-dependent oxidoreductase [Acidimicrobiia bacterium]
MRFGAFVPQGWRMDLVGVAREDHWNTILDVAGRIESAAFDSLWVYDHFHTVPDQTQEPTYEAWSLLAALAAVTKTSRLGQMCTCNGYRNPAYLAKVAAGIDVISGGRLEFSIGAGWYHEEYEAYGYPFPSGGTRIAELEESVEIVKKMWTEDEATYDGEHYQIAGAICQPKPLQDPHPPIWIAGGGEKKTLRVVAKHADYSNFGADPEHFAHKSEILRGHCEAIGRDFDEIGRTAIWHGLVGTSEADLNAKVSRVAEAIGRPEDDVRRRYTVGSPDQVAEELGKLAELGCVHVQCFFPDSAWGDSLEVFDTAVIPALN